jgi:hypothetical protein
MSLAQLTDKGTTIKGYCKLRILMKATSGEWLVLEAEVYVVKGMSVPILLGEDFQLNYELGVSRNVEEGTKILFKDLPYKVEASGIEAFAGRSEMQRLAAGLTSHARSCTKAREHRRVKGRRRRRAKRNGLEVKTVRASQDYRIRAHECKLVRVDGDFAEDKDWLVERSLLANAEDSFFTVPNVLISARRPVVPVSNMSDRPRMIRKGEILGQLTDPRLFFDCPSSEEELRAMQRKTDLLARLVQSRATQDEGPIQAKKSRSHTARSAGEEERRIRTDFGSGVPPSEVNVLLGVHTRDEKGRVPDKQGIIPSEEPESTEAEEYGPKTAAMPDATVFPSEKMEELLDVGSLPEGLKKKAWTML